MHTTPTTRPPVVAVMGHIDHGKSTLLDYIRKTNVTAGEAGGITQHLSAYEIAIPYHGTDRHITFIDTPGHAAFTGMRERGASAADIAILVVSAEDSVKAQTLEALATIQQSGIPFIVAINKIDKPEANVEKTKMDLAEHNVLVEEYGGQIPTVPVSATKGTGIDTLLETIILVADVEAISGSSDIEATGIVIESRLDPKRGVAATLIIKNGTLHKGQFVVAGTALATTRIMENFMGQSIDAATPGTAVQLVGFDSMPEVGATIKVFAKKRDAEEYIETQRSGKPSNGGVLTVTAEQKIIPVIIKADVYGTVEAIESEIRKIQVEDVYVKILTKNVGAIGEADIKLAQSDEQTIILGFNVDLDARARDLNEKAGVQVQTFDIIYKLTEWLAEELERRRPRKEVREVIGSAKVLKTFSHTKERQVLGCRVTSGVLSDGAKVSVLRREFPIATATIIELQQAKQKTKEVHDGECGALLECKTNIAPGDILEAFLMVTK